MASEDWPFANAWSLHGNKDILSRYEILERLGEGTFGDVHKARRREDNLIVALKEIHNPDSSCREIKALLLLDHPNVIKLHEYFAQGTNMVLVLEYLPYNLYEVICSGKGALSDGEVKGWMIQIIRGLAACHAASILHRDLKPNNLLISEDRTLKIADFGQARVVSEADYANEEGLYGSEVHNNYVAGNEGYSNHEVPTMRYSRELEFQADVSVAEGRRKSKAVGDHFGVGTSHSTSAGNLTKSIVEQISPGTDFPGDCAPRDSENLGRNDLRSGSGPTNVGYSALADAVKDARNYFTIEEMVRSGTRMDGSGLSGLQRQHIIGSQQHTEDPGCRGWFPMENVESHPAMTGVRNLSSADEITAKDDMSSVGRGHQVREREGDLSSDGSDVDWKGKYGIRSEDLIDTLKRTEETHMAGVSSTSAKGEGDFLQKLRRFIRKRTRRLSTEGKIAGPGHSRNERTSITARDNSLKETQRDGHTLHVRRSSGVKSTTSVVHGMPLRIPTPSENMAQARARKGIRNFHGKEKKLLKVGSINNLDQGPVVADGGKLERMDGVSVTSGINDQHPAQQCKESGGLTLPENSEDEFMDEEDGDLSTESGRKLYGGLQVEKVERTTRSNKLVVNGPLREMAYARVHEVRETAVMGQPEFKDNFLQAERDFSEAEPVGCGHISSIDMEKSKGDKIFRTTEDENEEEGNSVDVPADEVTGANNCAIPSFWGKGWKDVDNLGETLNGRWEASSAERTIPGRESWTQMEGYNSISSTDAEGTRWYGAPEFQYSYMDSKNAEDPAGGTVGAGGMVHDEMYGRATGSEQEWEDGSEGGTYPKSGGGSQESIGRGSSESDHGPHFTTMVGTRWYKAPELLYGATKYGKGIDIWAVGCIFGELLWGKPLFPGLNDIDQLSRLVRILGSPNEELWAGVSLLPDFNKICFVDDRSPVTLKNYLPGTISEAALDFLQKLLTYDPMLRPSVAKALEDEFFFKQPVPCPRHELQLPTEEESEVSDGGWGDWKDPGSPFSDFEILGFVPSQLSASAHSNLRVLNLSRSGIMTLCQDGLLQHNSSIYVLFFCSAKLVEGGDFSLPGLILRGYVQFALIVYFLIFVITCGRVYNVIEEFVHEAYSR